MEHILLHTKSLGTPLNNTDDYVSCGKCSTSSGDGWVSIEEFVKYSSENFNTEQRNYTYCQDCANLITPMQWLAYVEL